MSVFEKLALEYFPPRHRYTDMSGSPLDTDLNAEPRAKAVEMCERVANAYESLALIKEAGQLIRIKIPTRAEIAREAERTK